jgi:copper chaperone
VKAVNTVTMRIEGMHCEGCAERIVTLLKNEPGVRDATVSFADGEARVRYNPRAVHKGRLVEVVEGGRFSIPADNHD